MLFRTQLRPLVKDTLVAIMVRPEDINISPWNGDGRLANGQIPGTVAGYTFLGRTIRLEVQLRNGNLVTVAIPKHRALKDCLDPGTAVALAMHSCQVFPVAGWQGSREEVQAL